MTRANLLLIRELNVNGDGDFADVMIQLERPLTCLLYTSRCV